MQDALNLFSLPFVVSSVTENDSCTLYALTATDKSATINRLNTRLKDLSAYLGEEVSVVINKGIFLRVDKPQKTVYNYLDYDGYVSDKYGSYEIPYMVGLTSKECIVDDLTKAPHLLIAGTTGSGKSVYLHTLIHAMLCNSNVNLSMIDCKMVEFSVYKNCANVYTDVKGAYFITAWFLQEIKNRFEKMQEEGYTDFRDYRKVHPEEVYNVLVIDELADLLLDKEAKKVIAPRLQKIAQIGRAAGFHMVLATQRPDCKTIEGVLKANIPTRIAFHCSSRIDSQVILDRTGAEVLTGNGDGLFLKNGAMNPVRFQGCLLTMNEVKNKLAKAGIL